MLRQEIQLILRENRIEVETIIPIVSYISVQLSCLIDKLCCLSTLKEESNLTIETLDEVLQVEGIRYRNDVQYDWNCYLLDRFSQSVRLRLTQCMVYKLKFILFEIDLPYITWDAWNEWFEKENHQLLQNGFMNIVRSTEIPFKQSPFTNEETTRAFSKLVSCMLNQIIRLSRKFSMYRGQYTSDVFLRFLIKYSFPQDMYVKFNEHDVVIQYYLQRKTIIERAGNVDKNEEYFYQNIARCLYHLFDNPDMSPNEFWKRMESPDMFNLVKMFLS